MKYARITTNFISRSYYMTRKGKPKTKDTPVSYTVLVKYMDRRHKVTYLKFISGDTRYMDMGIQQFRVGDYIGTNMDGMPMYEVNEISEDEAFLEMI